MNLRRHHKPLCEPKAIYNVLSVLQIGDPVPLNILVLDYEDGEIPCWIVREREENDLRAILTVVDEGNSKPVGLDILTFPAKTLASGKPFLYFPGCEHCRNMLTDIRQHARAMCDKWEKIPAHKDVSQAQFWQEPLNEVSA